MWLFQFTEKNKTLHLTTLKLRHDFFLPFTAKLLSRDSCSCCFELFFSILIKPTSVAFVFHHLTTTDPVNVANYLHVATVNAQFSVLTADLS